MAYQSIVGGFNKPTTTTSSSSSMDQFSNSRNKTGDAGTTDIIIVGAGVAGSALAYTLGKDGRRVQVIERDLNEPDRFVGEALLPGGYLKLMELGLQDCVEKIDAQQIFGFILYKDGKNTKLRYPFENFNLNASGRTFHNGRFIQKLRKKAASIPNVRLEQGTVTSLFKENGTIKGVHYKSKSGEELTASAPLTIVCDGCFSNLRRSLCNPKVDVPSYFVALLIENCDLSCPNYAHQIMARPSVVIFYPISSTEVRCMIDVPSHNLPSVSNGEMAHYLKTEVAPQIPDQGLHDAFIYAIDKGNNIRTMPIRVMAAAPEPTPGALLIGDAFNIRHPLSRGGMTVALSDVVLLRDLLRPIYDLSDSSAICKYLDTFYTLRKPMASTMNTMAGVMHKVYTDSPSDPVMEGIREALFDYLSLGGRYSNGLMALLAGLNPCPLSLLLNLFSMILYGVGCLLLPFPSPKRMWTGAMIIKVALGFLLPLVKAEGVRPMFFPKTMPAYYKAPPVEK